MSDRLISNNMLVAFETLHHLKNKRKGKEGLMAIKLDMSKAYDRVEWIFLEKLWKNWVLQLGGFHLLVLVSNQFLSLFW